MAANPHPVALPAEPPVDFWNETQWAVFFSLLEAALPPIAPESDLTDKAAQVRMSDEDYFKTFEKIQKSLATPPSERDFKAYLGLNPARDPGFVANLKRYIANLPLESQKRLGGILSLLATKAGSLFLTGHCVPLQEQPIHVREQIIKSWQASRLGPLRVLARVVTTVAAKTFAQTSPLLQQLIGYTDAPRDYKAGPEVDFKFLQFDAGREPAILDVDVVIVGSGCGGAVCAKILAEAGHSVLVVDKSYYFPPSQLPMPQDAGSHYLYENSGAVASDDSSCLIVAGSCWGGGGAVNWSVCLQTQGYVRQEWAEQAELPFFTSSQFQESLDRVCDFMGASTKYIRHRHAAQLLLDGSRELGWHAAHCPQNTGGTEHYCGRCHLGCGSAEKKGTAVSWLPAAVAAGAKCTEGFHVEKVTFDEHGKSRRATGVVGSWVSRDKNGNVSGPQDERITRRVVVKAKKVIISCGSLWSPLVLMNSGLTNRHIGMNLHIHPAAMVLGVYEEDVQPWEGGIITSYNSTFENLDGAGHGVKLETTCMVPFAVLSSLPWRGGLEFKSTALKFGQSATFISLARDRDSGRVYPDPVTKKPRVKYTPSNHDSSHILQGLVALAKICYVTGAREIYAFLPGLEPFIRGDEETKGDSLNPTTSGINDPAFAAWLAKLRKTGFKPPEAGVSSAHQMGTCRMSSNEDEGVVDPKGRVWGTENLFVADASVFPSASGVNPMITNMAISDWIAKGVGRELESEKAPST